MENNVLAWSKALQMGLNPMAYPFEMKLVPTGLVVARLDFKIWAKKVMGINGFFSQEGGLKFQITVFLNKELRNYQFRKDGVDFAFCPLDCRYELKIGMRRDRPFLESLKCLEI
ncbi:hypothetical protein SAMN05444266_10292 [Chitinophaga jiangningensis]|uniref:Uncharacterized protein n=1 Tax=Chitinophaga jiangningensis TaxID=1419482 RepID=A0A1M6Y015_9BACT|nr:hypothetical protein [Chitinophaga jiangningensis]SHL11534.1 hypothetical protein SAMN05444266_10292 [Chitinophaga jiangningensis]